MSFESADDIVGMAAQEALTPQEILENPEVAFVKGDLDSEQQAEAISSHEKIIADPTLFIGSGNDGMVFDLPSSSKPTCLKHIWEHVSVEIRGKQFYRLPSRLQELRKVQDYFETVREGRKEAARKGNIEFAPSNSPIVEAGYQTAARKLLEDAGFHDAVPMVKSLVRIETKGEGDIDGVPFMYDEMADVIAMERVSGKSIQDLVLGYEQHLDVIERLNTEEFRETLMAQIRVLHENDLTHQDVTNRNIMLDFDRLKPVIIDFGKACHRGGSFSKEQEMGHIEAVCRVLSAFKKDPEGTRKELKRRLKIAF